MRILFVVGGYPLSMHTFVTREIGGAISLGANVLVLAENRGDAEGKEQAKAIGMPPPEDLVYRSIKQSSLFSLDLRRLTKKYRAAAQPNIYGRALAERRKTYFCDVVDRIEYVDIVHGIFVGWSHEIAFPLSKLLGARLVVTVHNSHAQLRNQSLTILEELQEASSALIFVSHASMRLWKDRTSRDDKQYVVYNAIDLGEFKTLPVRSRNKPIHIISVGRLSDEKRLSEGIKIAHRLKQEGYQVRYLIVGDGPNRASLERLVSEKQLRDSVKFVSKLPHDRVRALLRESDLLLHPGVDESFGVVVAEGMASLKPVVAARSGALPELVKHGETGFLYEPGDEREAVGYIKKLIDNRRDATEMGACGRKRVEAEFSWHLHLNQMSQIWSNVISS